MQTFNIELDIQLNELRDIKNSSIEHVKISRSFEVKVKANNKEEATVKAKDYVLKNLSTSVVLVNKAY